MTEHEIHMLADAIAARTPNHACRFDDEEAKRIHAFSDMLDRDGMANFRAVLDFGATLTQARKAGVIALAGALALGIAGIIWNAITSR